MDFSLNINPLPRLLVPTIALICCIIKCWTNTNWTIVILQLIHFTVVRHSTQHGGAERKVIRIVLLETINLNKNVEPIHYILLIWFIPTDRPNIEKNMFSHGSTYFVVLMSCSLRCLIYGLKYGIFFTWNSHDFPISYDSLSPYVVLTPDTVWSRSRR